MNKQMIKKSVFAASMAVAMLGISTAAQAEKFYCVAYAFDNDEPTVATIISTNKDEHHEACDQGCENEWSHYVKSNFKNWYRMHPGLLGPFKHQSEAKAKYYDFKSKARDKWHQAFYHASNFSCSGD